MRMFTHQISKANLCSCFVVFVGDAFDTFVEHIGRCAGIDIWMSQRTKTGDNNIPFFAEFRQLALIYSRRAFDLIYDGCNFRNRKYTSDLFTVEIRHTNTLHQTECNALFHGRPRFQIINVAQCTTTIRIAWPLFAIIFVRITEREMNQKQINVLQIEIYQRLTTGVLHFVGSMKCIPQLKWPAKFQYFELFANWFCQNSSTYFGHNKYFAAFDHALGNFFAYSLPNCRFIVISPSGVDVTVASIDGHFHRALDFITIWLREQIKTEKLISTNGNYFPRQNEITLTAHVPKPIAGIRLPSLKFIYGTFVFLAILIVNSFHTLSFDAMSLNASIYHECWCLERFYVYAVWHCDRIKQQRKTLLSWI